EDGRLTEREADPDRDRDQEEGDDEREAPAPVVEGLVAEVDPDAGSRRQRYDDAECGRRLQPARVVPAMLVLDVLGDVRDGAAVLRKAATGWPFSKNLTARIEARLPKM